jgi:hypothetical protein
MDLSSNFDNGIPVSVEYVFSFSHNLESTAFEIGVLFFKSLFAIISPRDYYNAYK